MLAGKEVRAGSTQEGSGREGIRLGLSGEPPSSSPAPLHTSTRHSSTQHWAHRAMATRRCTGSALRPTLYINYIWAAALSFGNDWPVTGTPMTKPCSY